MSAQSPSGSVPTPIQRSAGRSRPRTTRPVSRPRGQADQVDADQREHVSGAGGRAGAVMPAATRSPCTRSSSGRGSPARPGAGRASSVTGLAERGGSVELQAQRRQRVRGQRAGAPCAPRPPASATRGRAVRSPTAISRRAAPRAPRGCTTTRSTGPDVHAKTPGRPARAGTSPSPYGRDVQLRARRSACRRRSTRPASGAVATGSGRAVSTWVQGRLGRHSGSAAAGEVGGRCCRARPPSRSGARSPKYDGHHAELERARVGRGPLDEDGRRRAAGRRGRGPSRRRRRGSPCPASTDAWRLSLVTGIQIAATHPSANDADGPQPRARERDQPDHGEPGEHRAARDQALVDLVGQLVEDAVAHEDRPRGHEDAGGDRQQGRPGRDQPPPGQERQRRRRRPRSAGPAMAAHPSASPRMRGKTGADPKKIAA